MDEFDYNENEKISKLLENNVSSYGATSVRTVRDKKRISRNKFKKNVLRVIKRGFPLLLVVMIYLGGVVVDNIEKNNAIKSNVDYVTSSIIPDVFHELSEDGFSEKSIMYYIKEIYGYDGLDIIANKKNYSDGGEYIISQGYKDEVKSSNGETLYYELPREREFFKDSEKSFMEESSKKNEDFDSIKVSLYVDIYNHLNSKGLSKDSSMYYIKKEYGKNGFDIVSNYLGFKDGGEYMISLGYKDSVKSSSGETVYYDLPDESRYEKDMRQIFADEVNNLKSNGKGL